MDIQQLKREIVSNKFLDTLYILIVDTMDNFIANQYLDYMIKNCNKSVNYLETLETLFVNQDDIFADNSTGNIYFNIYKTEILDVDYQKLSKCKNLIIVTTKIQNSEITEHLASNIVALPKLEDWQIKDYAYSVCEGCDLKDLDWLILICKDNLYRLDNELYKISIFDSLQRKYILKDFIQDNFYEDLSNNNIFTLTTALQNKDIDTIKSLLMQLKYIDVEPVGLITLMVNNFRKLIMVWLNNNPTPENTGLKSNQIWAIKNLTKNYTKDQLINIYKELTLIDLKLKSGQLPANLIIDYIILKILST